MTNHGRLIDADALVAQMEADAEHMEEPIAKMFAYAAINDVKHAPTIEERKTGHWIPQDHNHTHGNVSTCIYFSPVCSECGHTGDFNMDFCPNCGAKMEVTE